METRAGSPEQFVSILCMQDTELFCQEGSLALASGQKGLKFVDVAAKMRRLLGFCVGAVRQDVLITEAVDGPSGSAGNKGACVTNKKSEKYGAGQKKVGWRTRGRRGQSERRWPDLGCV